MNPVDAITSAETALVIAPPLLPAGLDELAAEPDVPLVRRLVRP
jgi:hypothetical protein